MTLATRCSACGTIFRVVDDQLRVSDGWVRCGRCDTVFDALEGMVDLEQQQPFDDDTDSDRPVRPEPDRSAPAHAGPIDIHHLLARHDERPDDVDDRMAADDLAHDADAERQQPLDIDLDHAHGSASAASAPLSEPTPAATPPIDGPTAATVTTHAAAAAAAPSSSGSAADRGRAATVSPPGFVKQAEREAHWNSPAMRAALLGSSLILLLMLLLQVVYHQRDAIAARSPLAGSWLRSACARWNCSIEAPRNIREVTIENSALIKVTGQPEAAKLSLILRNRSADDLAMPAVELNLTDFEGRLIARKALLPEVFRVDPPVIAGNSELPVHIIVSAGERRIAGYTVELFYP